MKIRLLLLFSLFCFGKTFAQQKIYFSWGYNKEWYTPSNIHIKQADLGNDYTFHKVRAHDQIGWDDVFNHALTVPQYSIRVGTYLKNNYIFEGNFEHTKYVVTNPQMLHMTGTYQGRSVDTTFETNADNNNLYYKLNNGANFFLFNFGKIYPLYTTKNEKFKVQGIGKAGLGIVYPHVQNIIMGVPNKPHFQFGGFNTGLEGDIRLTFFKHFYVEGCLKVDYAWYYNLRLSTGTARQNFGTFLYIWNLGMTF
jgi:hypothetical protein